MTNEPTDREHDPEQIDHTSQEILNLYATITQAAENPDSVDVPLPDVPEDLDEQPDPLAFEDMNELDVMEAVMKRGAVAFPDGGRLTKCPAYDDPAVCRVYPQPHQATQIPILVCTGPTSKRHTKFKLFDDDETYYDTDCPAKGCPYHPDRINQPAEEIGLERDGTSGRGWFK